MTETLRARLAGAAVLLATVILPLIGAWAAGRDLAPIFLFPPPLAVPTQYPHFSWAAAAVVVLPYAMLAIAWVRQRGQKQSNTIWPVSFNGGALGQHANPSGSRPEPSVFRRPTTRAAPTRYPTWGWIALGWTLGWWILAWSRFEWFAPLQRYTFFPLWFGFCVSINAITVRRSGTCVMLRTPGRWVGLFVASAGFWWVFEWLNRFTHNWHYLGVSEYGPLGYAAHATLCFSTVLPAVTAVAELFATSARWQNACAAGPSLRWVAQGWTGIVFLAIGGFGLLGAGAFPERCYAALWAAPLALLLGDGILARRRDVTGEVAAGDWRRVASWAVAALVCGFFWEMWNAHSAAKWMYTVPFTDRWHVFEMPLLGYTGYLPFGLECYCVVARIFGADAVVPFSRVSST